jgi:hypothetical protein
VHGTLMLREMLDPSEALPVIVEEFVRPMMRAMEQIISHLFPQLSRQQVERSILSVVGQVQFYRSGMPAVLAVRGEDAYPRGFTAQLAEHITAFSIGGLARLAAGKRRARRGR